MSKSIRIPSQTGYITPEEYSNYVNKNRGIVVPYTRLNGSIGYNLIDVRPDKFSWKPSGHTFDDNLKYLRLKALDAPRLDAGNKDYMRNLWQTYNQQSLRPYDNYLTESERIEQLRNDSNLFLDIENNPNANYDMPWYTVPVAGEHYVNRYNNIIEYYANQHNIDPNLVKAIMYNEAATGHWGGANYAMDIFGWSDSQMPMNIQGSTWGNFDGQYYDTKIPSQNIELGVQVIKRLQNSIHNPTIEKIATLYNSTGAMEINDYGARTKTIYDQKPWLKK